MCPSKEWFLVVFSVAALKSYFWWYSMTRNTSTAKTMVFLPILEWVHLLVVRMTVFPSQIRLRINRGLEL